MWIKCPAKAWEAASLWVNSGQSLKEYSLKHGRVFPQQQQSTEKPVTKEETPEPALRDPTQLRRHHKYENYLDEKESTIQVTPQVTPGIRHELIKELQIRGDRLRDELTAITKLLEQYI